MQAKGSQFTQLSLPGMPAATPAAAPAVKRTRAEISKGARERNAELYRRSYAAYQKRQRRQNGGW